MPPKFFFGNQQGGSSSHLGSPVSDDGEEAHPKPLTHVGHVTVTD